MQIIFPCAAATTDKNRKGTALGPMKEMWGKLTMIVCWKAHVQSLSSLLIHGCGEEGSQEGTHGA